LCDHDPFSRSQTLDAHIAAVHEGRQDFTKFVFLSDGSAMEKRTVVIIFCASLILIIAVAFMHPGVQRVEGFDQTTVHDLMRKICTPHAYPDLENLNSTSATSPTGIVLELITLVLRSTWQTYESTTRAIDKRLRIANACAVLESSVLSNIITLSCGKEETADIYRSLSYETVKAPMSFAGWCLAEIVKTLQHKEVRLSYDHYSPQEM
jgi:hypothetical protein